MSFVKSFALVDIFVLVEVFAHGGGFVHQVGKGRGVESKPKRLRKEFTRLFVNKFWNKYNSYFSKGFCPILGLQSYRQHSALIPSVEVPTFNKVEIPVFTMLVPGSIASIHS